MFTGRGRFNNHWDMAINVEHLFSTTSDDTGDIGKPGHNSDKSWTKFYAKYRAPCMTVIKYDYPQWANEAEDVFQRVAASIHDNPNIINRKKEDTLRTVLCNLCTKEMRRLHHPKREEAKRRFMRLAPTYLRNLLHPSSSSGTARAKLQDLVLFIRDDMLDKDYENGRYFQYLDETDFSLWRHVQLSETGRVSDTARTLGLNWFKVCRANARINGWILKKARELAAELQYL